MAQKKVTMRVYGMTCEDCVTTVSSRLKEAGASDIQVSLGDGTATVVIDDSMIEAEDLVKAPVFGKTSHYKAQIRKVE
ncbi:MAG: heavy-metal-associated domain-containing protein [Thermoplasmataceae archaeon]